MAHSTFTLQDAQQRTIFGQVWSPAGNAKAVVCIIHGLGDHSGRYTGLVDALMKNEYGVVAIDQLGHGQSDGQRGHIGRYSDLMDVITLLLTKAKAEFPDRPVFLCGHSWGGNLVLNYVLRLRPDLKGVISMSPWLKLAFNPSTIKLTLAKWVQVIYPAFSQPNEIAAENISRDKEVVKAYKADPLVHDQISASLFFNSHQAALWALKQAGDFPLPLLMIHGTEDRVTSPSGTKEFASKVKKEIEVQLMQGRYHETHNDLGREEVFTVIIDWLNRRLSST